LAKPHDGHEAGRLAPHCEQKRREAAFDVPQDEQARGDISEAIAALAQRESSLA
jgi:hypothetical protein